MARKILFSVIILSVVLAGCMQRITPTLDMPQLQTIAAQTAVVQATQLAFETQIARLTQGVPATAVPLLPTNTPVVITAVPTLVPPTAVVIPTTAVTALPTLPPPASAGRRVCCCQGRCCLRR